MNYKSIVLAFSIIVVSCKPKQKVETIEYQNIIILSDLSSRLDNMPNKDFKKIYGLIDYFKNECVAPGKKSGDKSSIYFSALSEPNFYGIDIDSLESLEDKQMFVNSKLKFAGKGLDSKIIQLKENIKNVYSKRDPGIDLISVLIEKLENNDIVKLDKTYKSTARIDSIKYINHIYLLTDGYLEYQDFNTNKQFYFGKSEINNLRQYCLSNNVDISRALQNNPKLGIPPIKASKNQFVNIHIWETHERDRDFVKNIYLNPKGLRDNEILEVVWKKWSLESGFKSFEWKKY